MALSLRECGNFDPIIIFYQDIETKKAFELFSISNLTLLPISQLISHFPLLAVAKENRAKIEFYYCLTPFVIKYARLLHETSIISYVDADIYFFKNFYSEIENLKTNFSARIVSHRFKESEKYLEKYGKFNVGILQFNASNGDKVLDWWAESCIRSTSLIATENSFGDQKYLDHFQNLDPSTIISENSGENVAPWNLISEDVESSQGCVYIEGKELIYFHFSGLKLFRFGAILGFAGYSRRAGSTIWKLIYRPYVRFLRNVEKTTKLNSHNRINTLNRRAWLREFYYFDYWFL